MKTSQSAQSPFDNSPKKSLVGWRRFVGEHSCLLVAVKVVLFSCCFVLKGKCMTKVMKVCIVNNQRINSWKCASTESLDNNKKTLILVFRQQCWHNRNKRTKSAEPFKAMNEMFIFNSFCIWIKYLRCCFAFFVLEIAVFTCSTVSFRSLQELSKF